MKRANFLSICLGILVAASLASTAKAGLIVTGTETTPGNYLFGLSQDASVDPIQNKGFIPLSFTIDLPGALISSFTGSLTDGTTLLTPSLFGWGDLPGTALSIDPNLINSGNSGPLTIMGTPGIDFGATPVLWRFTSNESLSLNQQLEGFVVLGGVTPPPGGVPEPSILAIFGIGLIGVFGGYRRRQQGDPVTTRKSLSILSQAP